MKRIKCKLIPLLAGVIAIQSIGVLLLIRDTNNFSPESSLRSTSLNPKAQDVAIIISSSYIRSHPSSDMIDTVIKSLDLLVGLDKSTPVFIIVDTFIDSQTLTSMSIHDEYKLSKKLDALEKYNTKLFESYLPETRIHILPGMTNLHVGGSVLKALELIAIHYTQVAYLYYLQHDLPFTKPVDHQALIAAMESNPQVNYVGFLKQWNIMKQWSEDRKCGNQTAVSIKHTPLQPKFGDKMKPDKGWGESLELHPTWRYSDQNHFVRFHWYKSLIASIGNLRRFPEDPLRTRASERCALNQTLGLYIYGEGVFRHLDGKRKYYKEDATEFS